MTKKKVIIYEIVNEWICQEVEKDYVFFFIIFIYIWFKSKCKCKSKSKSKPKLKLNLELNLNTYLELYFNSIFYW